MYHILRFDLQRTYLCNYGVQLMIDIYLNPFAVVSFREDV